MSIQEPSPLLLSAVNYDCAVTDIDYVVDRGPDPSWRISKFVNSQAHLLAYAISGKAHYEIAGSAYHVRPGSLIVMPSGTEHTATSDSDDPWHFISIAFKMTATHQDPVRLLGGLPAVSTAVPGDVAAAFHQMYGAWNSRSPGFLLQIRGLASTVLFKLIEAQTTPAMAAPHTRRISAITQLMTENYANTYSVEQLASRTGLSSSHFRVMFKRVTGMTATNYQQHVKITKATELLSSGEFNVTETAMRTGFNDVYYFSRLFKQLTGTNPSQLCRR